MTKDFLISYNKADAIWAEWLAWVLEEHGKTVVIQAWDFRPGGNFVLDMQRAAIDAQRTVMVLSENYLNALYTQPEWAAAFGQDPTATARKLLPIRVAPCQPQGMLAPLVYVDLVGLEREPAQKSLLDALKDRLKPEVEPVFPGSAVPPSERQTPATVVSPRAAPPPTCPAAAPLPLSVARRPHQPPHPIAPGQPPGHYRHSGMGGIGKTELALQYALRHRDLGTYPGGIGWLQAKEQNLGTELVNFAIIHLGLTVPTDLDLPAQAQFCWRNWPIDGDALIVIDDVAGPNENDAYAAIQPYLPPQEPRFWVLLTTRLQLGTSVRTYRIDVLTPAAALELLASLIGQERIEPELDTAPALCHWLGYLPLGLELVGRFLARKPTWTLVKMQQQLEAKKLAAQALTQGHADMTATHAGVAAAFELSWQDLEEPVRELAYRLCLFALAPIAWEWIENWHEATDPDTLEDWRDEGLINRSLLTLVEAAPATVQLHQIIREFFRAKLEEWPDADALKQSYTQSMVQIAQTIPQTPTRDQILAVTAAIPHLAEAATTWQGWMEDESLIWPFVGLGQFYQGQGAYGQADLWFQACRDIVHNRLGKQHPDFAKSLNNLGLNHYYQGRYKSAEVLLKQALNLRQKFLGENNQAYAQSLNNLGICYYNQGQYEAAESYLNQALQLRGELFGEMHVDFLESLNNLGMLYQAQGNYEHAEILLKRVLELTGNLSSKTHPDIARSLNNLGMLYVEKRQFEDSNIT
ncbi:MAG: tetratricopeptide repeat protein [Leptolyngbyaceae cyanobacterium SM2_5_2]|nr:tetratricopeptide repeat protein [Leptolyngbyaceae cyanobacterium SM2_5_2]